MFLAHLARKITNRTHSHLLSPLILTSQSTQHDRSPHFYTNSRPNFSQAFHRTLGTRSQNPNHTSFSSSESSRIQKLYESINLIESNNEITNPDVIQLVKLLRSDFDTGREESMGVLDGCSIKPSENLIVSVIWVLRDDWKLALFVFKWGRRWNCSDEKAWGLMIWVLGNHKKFNNGWCLIRDLYQSSMETWRPMLIMIDRYAAANEPSEAIRAFQIMERFKLTPDQNAFYTLLETLCDHGNVEEAEEFMFQNAKLFPFETEGFNIILKGWCNIYTDIVEAKRIWKEMDKNSILPDESSYTLMISCFSKVNNLFDSIRLYDEMKKKGWKPNFEVYNSLVYVLAHENCIEEALTLLDTMKNAGFVPGSTTFGFVIRALCKVGRVTDARLVLSRMLGENVSPSIDTYHAFLETKDLTFEESFELLDLMTKSGTGPDRDTFGFVISALCKAGRVTDARRVLSRMLGENVSPSIDTYHAFLETKDLTFEESFELLDQMSKTGTGPNRDTFGLILGGFLRVNEVENAMKTWVRMKEYEVLHDSSHFVMMVEGLVKHGFVTKARELYAEMVSTGVTVDPRLAKMVKDRSQDDERKKIKKVEMRRVNVYRGKKWFRGKRSKS